ncbi:MAG: cysteine--tRNA ligase [Candidatus Pacebacteria bacterium]|nr:cysteine--tRNA ligase [Candidatus Paceibacterota bacterium]MDD5555318.1 cysteine--tRNA ligase [Candidatus Paceibacterota bacterium]
MFKLYNTLKRKKEEFKPLKDKEAGMYTCGPTVYWYAHIGNLRTYIFEDLLKRVLEYDGYKVKHAMNITDVGHLTSDSDTGEDKLEKGAKKERKTVWDIADFYTKQFKKDLKALNIKEPDVWVKATDTIKEQINLIKDLEKKGFTYVIKDGVYFDTSKLEKYGRLWGPKERKELKGRIEEVKEKKNKTDFALWKFSPKDEKRQMEWDSPWGKGFPGWHTECVVMSSKELGIPFDIHCGAVDHVSIHHTNEIAQAEAAFGKPLANFWLHGEFLTLKGGKMSKSLGNIVTLGSLIEKGINPLAFRYLCLGVHYRSKLIFSDESIEFASNSLNKLYEKIFELKQNSQKENKEKKESYKKKFLNFINDDLNLPQALALTWDMLKDKDLGNKDKYELLLDFDKVFGLNLSSISLEEKDSKYIIKTATEEGVPVWTSDINILPLKVKELIKAREEQRKEKEWDKADESRKAIENLGWVLEDSGERTVIKKRPC